MTHSGKGTKRKWGVRMVSAGPINIGAFNRYRWLKAPNDFPKPRMSQPLLDVQTTNSNRHTRDSRKGFLPGVLDKCFFGSTNLSPDHHEARGPAQSTI